MKIRDQVGAGSMDIFSKIKLMDRGPLLWTAPIPAQAPRYALFILALGSIGLGVAIGTLSYDILFAPGTSWTNVTTWITAGLPAALVFFGVFLIYSGINQRKPQGIQFFQYGVEIGEGAKRKLIKYGDLEIFTCALIEPNNGVDTAVFALRTVVSIAAMNPAGIGRAIGELNQEPIYSELTIKPRDSGVLAFPLTLRDHKSLAPLFVPS